MAPNNRFQWAVRSVAHCWIGPLSRCGLLYKSTIDVVSYPVKCERVGRQLTLKPPPPNQPMCSIQQFHHERSRIMWGSPC